MIYECDRCGWCNEDGIKEYEENGQHDLVCDFCGETVNELDEDAIIDKYSELREKYKKLLSEVKRLKKEEV